MTFAARHYQRCEPTRICYCRIRPARHQRLHNRERTSATRPVQRSLSITILCIDIVLAPVLDEPVRDGGLVAVDGVHQRCSLLKPLLLQHRRINQHVLLHRLQILIDNVEEDGMAGHGWKKTLGAWRGKELACLCWCGWVKGRKALNK